MCMLCSGKALTPEEMNRRKYRNKWYRAYTLARNPCIVLERLQQELKDKNESKLNGELTVSTSNSRHMYMQIFVIHMYIYYQ